ncbi:amidohydrolase family protein [Bosea vestrisii]|uniref:metal-dependent hydrolase family protein n=1 Tax=Bosea vestrisii TaxID=151416 RepID=UPI0024DFA9A4|nr:amidohydrolase family protein [Bosea vestrisii]WID95215.1 amidohydrolase family protein [Bosea vestrisii]
MTVTVIDNANVLDVDRGEILEGQKVVIENNEIKDVSRGGPNPGDWRVIDAKGATVMPGLIDAHVHITAYAGDFGTLSRSSPSYVAAHSARTLKRTLLRGFTTVRDVGGADFGLAKAVEEGLFEGPRVLFGGKALSQSGGHGDMRDPGTEVLDTAYSQPGLGVVVDGVAEVRRAARAEIRRGAHHVKIMVGGGAASPTDRLDSDQFSEEEISAVVEEAEMANVYAVAHAYSARTISRAARLGVRSIEHGNFLDEPTAQLMKEKGCFLVPTLAAYHMSAKYGAEAGMSATTIEKINALVAPGIQAVEIARRLGIPMAYGTDLVGTMMQEFQLQEFSLRHDVVPNDELLRSATIVGAELVRLEKRIGRLATGYLADIIIVQGNPLRDITVLEKPESNLLLVMKEGRIYKNELR